jgi:DNA-binding NtrC family response regulator
MSNPVIMLVGEDPSVFEAATAAAARVGGLELKGVSDPAEARDFEAWDQVALVLAHAAGAWSTPALATMLREFAQARRPVATVILADSQDHDQELELIRAGAADYVARPFDPVWLAGTLDNLTVRARATRREPTPTLPAPDVPTRAQLGECIRPQASSEASFDDSSPDTMLLMTQVRRVAPQGTTILLSGETGSGKTRLAQRIHELSDRADEPFLVINCGALSASLVESEMFGHVRGAFTGADRDRAGKFAEVGRGTLFLDEVDTLSLTLQAKLLRVVEDRRFEPVGSNKTLPVRARLIAASNRSLDLEVAAQRFRSDLYYRLNVVGFHLPPLRERRSSIPGLASRFVSEFAARNGRDVRSLTPRAMRALECYDWPGNIRELRNVIERAVALCAGREVDLDDLPSNIARAATWAANSSAFASNVAPGMELSHATLAQIKREAELSRITEALEKHGNNRLRTANELGISRMTLYKKLYKYGLMHQVPESRHGVA